MKLKEKFIKESCDIRYQVLEPAKFEKIADDYAIEFAKWISYKYKYLDNKGWFATTYQLEMGIFLSSKELLEIFKKQNGL
jgi:hypothetical protein